MRCLFFRALTWLYFPILCAEAGFTVIVLGSGGGPLEINLSSYMVAPVNSDRYVAIDAGSLLGGMYVAEKSLKDFPTSPYNKETAILQNRIQAYLITHAHLDHVAGLIINSPIDTKKSILGLPSTIDSIRDHLFNGKIWPNFGSEGNKPILNQYQYVRLKENFPTKIPNTDMDVRAFPLSHPDGYISTAYLIRSRDDYLLHFGDTASDSLEKKKRIQNVWKHVAHLVKEKKLQHIFLECSYSNQRTEKDLFGHLNPKLWMEEFHHLASLVDPDRPDTALQGFHVYVIHIKETLLREGPTAHEVIQEELANLNDLGLILHFPKQGDLFQIAANSNQI